MIGMILLSFGGAINKAVTKSLIALQGKIE